MRPILIDRLIISRHAADRIKDRGIPDPSKLPLTRLTNKEAKVVLADFKKHCGTYNVSFKFANHSEFIYAVHRQKKQSPMYVLSAFGARMYTVVTCWMVNVGVAPISQKKKELMEFNTSSYLKFGCNPVYHFSANEETKECIVQHPSGVMALGVGRTKSAAKRDAIFKCQDKMNAKGILV